MPKKRTGSARAMVDKKPLGTALPPEVDDEFRAMLAQQGWHITAAVTAAIRTFMAFPAGAQRDFIRWVKEPERFRSNWSRLSTCVHNLPCGILAEPDVESADPR